MAGQADDTAEKEPQSREEWEDSLADDIALFESVTSQESKEKVDQTPPEDAPDSDAPAGTDAGPGTEAKAEPQADAKVTDAGDGGKGEKPEPEDEGEGELEEEVEETPEAAADAGKPDDDRGSEPELQPFAYKADGKDFSVEGAVLTRVTGQDGQEREMIVMPRDAWKRHVQPHLRDQGAVQARELDLRRQVAELDPQKNPEVLFSRKLTGKLDTLLRSDKDDWDEKLLDWAEKYRKDLPEMLKEVDTEAKDAQRLARERIRPQEEIDQELEQLGQSFEAALSADVDRVLGQIGPVDGLERDEVLEDLVEEHGPTLFFRAPDDMLEFGIKKGQWAIRQDIIETKISRHALKAKRRAEAAARAADVQKRNAARVQPTGAKPGVQAKSDVPKTRKAAGANQEFKSKDDWENALDEEFSLTNVQ